VLAPGSHPHPGYAEFADQLVTFTGPWSRYRWSEAPEWTAAHPPSRFAHLVHSLPANHLDTALRIARWQGAGTVCLTDRSDRGGVEPWEGLPGYWNEAVRKIRRKG
ncbi:MULTISPECIES: spherulation-specific family 4 protein, partial [unclassified Streptomyces]|uniref:spherulation-specific family 4 protein n=1 Tax=unclassified Streptomyces TaxID=2593676 RepID=UPI00139E4544|nr:phage tail protein [Streptomyces sp. SID4948]